MVIGTGSSKGTLNIRSSITEHKNGGALLIERGFGVASNFMFV